MKPWYGMPLLLLACNPGENDTDDSGGGGDTDDPDPVPCATLQTLDLDPEHSSESGDFGDFSDEERPLERGFRAEMCIDGNSVLNMRFLAFIRVQNNGPFLCTTGATYVDHNPLRDCPQCDHDYEFSVIPDMSGGELSSASCNDEVDIDTPRYAGIDLDGGVDEAAQFIVGTSNEGPIMWAPPAIEPRELDVRETSDDSFVVVEWANEYTLP